MNEKRRLLGMTLDELKGVAFEAGLPGYAAKQMADWLYKKKVTSIAAMTNIASAKRALLEKNFEVGAVPPSDLMKSVDGTIKYLYPAGPGNFVESVYIPTEDRATLCVSSQVGCKMNCLFCMTGKQGFTKNLSANEILNQIQSLPETEELTNIVFMGMGEPLDYVDERRSLMPVEKAFPACDIIETIKQYDFTHQRRVSFEYIVFKNLNDDLQHAKALVCLLDKVPCRVNLIRFHAIPNVSLESSDLARMEAFRDTLNAAGIVCTIRASRGEDIFAACGMLSTAKKQQKE